MSNISQNQARTYRNVGVNSSDPGKLVLLLYEGAIRYLGIAMEKIEQKKMEEGHNFLVRGKSIIAELMASLNMRDGDEISVNLQAIYAYIYDRLIDANLNKDPKIIHEVRELLKTLHVGWEAIYTGKQNSDSAGQNQTQNKKQLNVSV